MTPKENISTLRDIRNNLLDAQAVFDEFDDDEEFASLWWDINDTMEDINKEIFRPEKEE